MNRYIRLLVLMALWMVPGAHTLAQGDPPTDPGARAAKISDRARAVLSERFRRHARSPVIVRLGPAEASRVLEEMALLEQSVGVTLVRSFSGTVM